MSMDDRKSAFENKFAHDQDLQFRVEARACKLFGLWIAGEIGLSGEEAATYAKTIVAANLDEAGFDDVKRAVRKDLDAKNVVISEETLDARLDKAVEDAKAQLMQELQS
jgi:hypothetical protein